MSTPPRRQTLVLTRADVTRYLAIEECIDAVEHAFRMQGEGRTIPPAVLGAHIPHGGFHVKTAGLLAERSYFAAKINANFPANHERYSLPTIQGVIALFDVETGVPLALLDSIEITSMRTAAASAVAARYLARPDSTTMTVIGCGEQGRSQLRAIARVLPLRRIVAFDADGGRATRFADEMSAELNLDVAGGDDLGRATRESDVCLTCTSARRWIIGRDHVRPGSFVAAVGADNPVKQEIEPELLASSTVVADVIDQCATIGDLHHAILAGVMTRDDVYAELAEIVTRRKIGRRSEDEIIVFDSTGTALQDVAAAAIVYERAIAAGAGVAFDLAGAS
jgi:alanine dehydrogenase